MKISFNKEMPSVNMLGVESNIVGDLFISGDLRIDGNLKGTIKCSGKVLVGSSSKIEGEIECQEAEISGEVNGTITANGLITLKETSKIIGKVVTSGKLIVESGAFLLITCNTDLVDLTKKKTTDIITPD